jgi:hypothetical protein
MRIVLDSSAILVNHDLCEYGDPILITGEAELTIEVMKGGRTKEFVKKFMTSARINLILHDLVDSSYFSTFDLGYVKIMSHRDIDVGLFQNRIDILDLLALPDELEFIRTLLFYKRLNVRCLYCDEFLPYLYTFLFPHLEELHCNTYIQVTNKNRFIYKLLAVETCIGSCKRTKKVLDYLDKKFDSYTVSQLNVHSLKPM